ncbi:Avirulence (Avh) protein [Phytophthora megakarya]|uniref:RxLR effector protein n=1 Tax=Phytophthora megakarya TaxID=4795 RepID=A0A225W6E8_9STRA|nr:Avirulence (Avh) protein [Phytophthora megakarya]
MHLNYLLLVFATTLVTNITATLASTSTNIDQISLAKGDLILEGLKDSSLKRSLRVHDTEDASDDDVDEEERGWIDKLKFKWWFNNGMTPKKLFKQLGLEGLGQAVRDHKDYAEYLAFSKYWNKHH